MEYDAALEENIHKNKLKQYMGYNEKLASFKIAGCFDCINNVALQAES